MPKFFVVATPIGNLDDISARALEALGGVDLVLCEDTRVTRKLLEHYQIKTKTQSYHQHSRISKVNQIKEMVRQGSDLALVSDAGTPGISDPGGKLVEELAGEFPDLKIEPIPGPCAVTTALSVCGFPSDKFIFLGFPPHKKGRQKFWQEINKQKLTVVFYESTHRILKSLMEMESVIGDRPIMVGRELTKKFETIYRGTAGQVIEKMRAGSIKGEFVIIVSAK
jgi:16S rRNA (cytidine1402-2'-O)-methyltransferase